MTELTAEEKKKAAADKAAADKAREALELAARRLPDFNTVKEFGVRWLEKDQSNKDKYPKESQKKLDASGEAAKLVKGLKAKKSQTLTNNGVKLTLVKGYPVSEYFSSLFNDKQKEQYFVK